MSSTKFVNLFPEDMEKRQNGSLPAQAPDPSYSISRTQTKIIDATIPASDTSNQPPEPSFPSQTLSPEPSPIEAPNPSSFAAITRETRPFETTYSQVHPTPLLSPYPSLMYATTTLPAQMSFPPTPSAPVPSPSTPNPPATVPCPVCGFDIKVGFAANWILGVHMNSGQCMKNKAKRDKAEKARREREHVDRIFASFKTGGANDGTPNQGA